MADDNAGGAPGIQEPVGKGSPGPLVWHPLIRALMWVVRWYVFSLCLAVVWEFAVSDQLTLARVVVRGAWILLAVGLLTGLLLVVELWWSIFMHARKNYDRLFATIVVAIASLVVAAVLAPYLWGVTWLLDQAWSLLGRWAAGLDQVSGRQASSLPIWLEWVLVTAGTVVVLALLLLSLRTMLVNYREAFRLLGPKGALRGALVMTLIRLRAPRRDFFLQAPVIGWMPWFALSVVLYVSISVPGFRLVLPLAVAALAIVVGLDLIAPPLWLFLGTSEYGSFAAFHALRQSWRKYGVTLLDRTNPDGSGFYYAWRRRLPLRSLFLDPTTPRLWSLRTRPEMWESSVWLLMDHVMVVVVDVRGDSDIVRDEIDWVQQRSLSAKTWYLAGVGARVSDEQRSAVAMRYSPLGEAKRSRMVTGPALCGATWSRAGISLTEATGASSARSEGSASRSCNLR